MIKEILCKMRKILNRGQKLRIVLLTMMMIITAILETLGVSIVIPIISIIMEPEKLMANEMVTKICSIVGITEARQFLKVCLLAMIAIYVFKNAFILLYTYMQSRFIFNNQCHTQYLILNKFLNRPYESFLYVDTGATMRLISFDITNVFDSLSALMSLASELIVAIFLAVTIFIINPAMTCIISVLFIIMVVFTNKVLRRKLEGIGKETQRGNDGMNKWLLQALEGIKEVKIAHRENFFLKKYISYGKPYSQAKRKYALLAAIPRLLTETVFFVTLLSVVIVLVDKGGDMSNLFSQLSAFAVAAVRLMPSANRINGYMSSLAYMKPSVDRIMEVYEDDSRTHYESEEDATSSLSLSKGIFLKGICYKYPNTEKMIFDNADFSVPVGKLVGIIGTSGAGKTTIVDIMMGLLKVEAGTVLVDDVSIEKNYDKWLSMIGYIPQSIYLMDDTIKANVALGAESAEIDEPEVWRALEEAQIAEHVKKLPDGIETKIGERGVRLSGGQRQRLGIARALYRNPEVLIFDEATSALDNETEAAIMESIAKLHGKKTMIIIAHRLTTIQNCDIVYRVENGTIKKVNPDVEIK